MTVRSRAMRTAIALALVVALGLVSIWLDRGREQLPFTPAGSISGGGQALHDMLSGDRTGSDGDVIRAPVITRAMRAVDPISPAQKAEDDRFAVLGVTPTPAPPPPLPEDPLLRAAAIEQRRVLPPPYQVYTIETGDTLATIAARFGIEERYLAANNIGQWNAGYLPIGGTIIIPAGNGVLHEVRYGETLADIATRYQVPIEAIVEFTANGLVSADNLVETQWLYVPNACLDCPVPTPVDCIALWLEANEAAPEGTEIGLDEVDC